MAGLLAGIGGLSEASVLDLRFERKSPAVGVWTSMGGESVRIERCDLLISGLAIQTAEGEWVESEDWYGFLPLRDGVTTLEASGLPAGPIQALRFDVGLPSAINEADPARWEVDHPLHPEVNGLHWGWQGGYVFLALEGHWQPEGESGPLSGFSYHLARSENRVRVELPVTFEAGGPVTVDLRLDVEHLLQGVVLREGETSTHSRPGDPIAAGFRKRIPSAFSVEGVQYRRLQRAPIAQLRWPAPRGTTPYRLEVAERLPQVPLPRDNPLTLEGVALGKALFHDPRLSVNESQSCASCHDQTLAFSDGLPTSPGAEGQPGRRNAMALFNLAWAKDYFWDGRADTLREQVLLPIEDPHEMNADLDDVVDKLRNDAEMGRAFRQAFGSAGIDAERMAKALEQFLLSLVSQDSRLDRALDRREELTASERRGLQLFVTEHDPKNGLRGADCFHCHGGALFTDHDYKNNGLELAEADLGRMLVTGEQTDRGKFKTPSLRNVALTAPYMHDGRFETLEEVVEHYSSGVVRSGTLDPNLAKHPPQGLQLSEQEKEDLVAFLKTLTDETFTRAATEEAVAVAPAPLSRP